MRKLSLLALALLSFAAACDRGASPPTALRPTDARFAGKPGTLTDPTAALYVSNAASVLFQGDASFIEGLASSFAGSSRYLDGECGVTARVFALAGESGDMVFATAGTQDRKCPAFPRKVRLTFALITDDGSVTADGIETIESGGNLGWLERAANGGTPGFYIPVGTSQLRGLHIADDAGKCYSGAGGGLAFRPVLSTGAYAGADDVTVYRDAPDTWTVTSQSDETDPLSGQTIHHDKAYCKGNGKLYHMPVHFSIKTSRPLTP